LFVVVVVLVDGRDGGGGKEAGLRFRDGRWADRCDAMRCDEPPLLGLNWMWLLWRRCCCCGKETRLPVARGPSTPDIFISRRSISLWPHRYSSKFTLFVRLF